MKPKDYSSEWLRKETARRSRRSDATVVGVLERKGRFLVATPIFDGSPVNIGKADRRSGIRLGDLVLVSSANMRGGQGRIIKRIGRPDVARDVIEALLLDRGFSRGFTPPVEAEAEQVATAGQDPAADIRHDLRDLPTFTIDPPTARDFDDAISAQDVGGGVTRVWVHIADVCAFVRPNSLVDREAFQRGTSVYVPGTVEPMLPVALSNKACSLVPNEDRLTVTVELDFVDGAVQRTAFYRSRIRSDVRLDYPGVDRIFAGQARAAEPWGSGLALARKVAARLDEIRHERGAVAVESIEPEFGFSNEGHVTSVFAKEQTESHRVIEHLMIAANEAVARMLEARKLPTLYRVHERPDPERIEFLIAQLASLDIPTPPTPKTITPQQAAELAGELSYKIDEHVKRLGHGRMAFTSLLLRSLKQAYYSPLNIGHHGLHSTHYCHFTSPIRRYPDIICHRALLAAVGAGEDPPDYLSLADAGEWCSQREREAASAERRGDDIARCFLLEQELFREGWHKQWDGEVIGLIGAGAFVAFGEGQEGLLHVRTLKGDWWELWELETMLIGASSGEAIRLGDPISVRVRRVEPARGRVDLEPVDDADDE